MRKSTKHFKSVGLGLGGQYAVQIKTSVFEIDSLTEITSPS